MKTSLKILRLAALVAIFAFSANAAVQAKESYDRYSTQGQGEPDSKSVVNWRHVLTYPFELLRWPTSKGLVFTDRHRLMDKGEWMFEKAIDYGFTPRFDGVDFDILRMARLKTHFPEATLQSWVSFWPHRYFIAGGKAGWERIGGLPLNASTTLNYENRPEENFYGIGPDTSAGESNSYRLEQTKFEVALAYSENPSFSADVFAGYKRVNISDGTDGAKGKIGATFDGRQAIPGLEGDEIFSTGLRFVRDKRNQKENSTRGHLLRGGFSFNEGLYGSDARFFKYEAEGVQYWRLWSDRRVLVTRFYGEHNSETNHHSVPFHQMGQLGGFGSSVDAGETLRAYDRGRFYDRSLVLFNIEYRYTVYEYREWKVDAVAFWDEGQVFNRPSQFQFSDFRESYGGGFRLSLLNNVLLSIEAAHGDEGTNYYVKSHSPF